jgi:hypothetical protein
MLDAGWSLEVFAFCVLAFFPAALRLIPLCSSASTKTGRSLNARDTSQREVFHQPP